MKDWKKLDRSCTADDVIKAITHNANNSEELDSMSRHKYTSGIIWTGRETIEGQQCEFGHNVIIPASSIRQIQLDNWQLYFSSTNEILILDKFNIDISEYISDAPQYLYINDDTSYELRYSKVTEYNPTKVLIARIIQQSVGNVLQCYAMPYIVSATHFEVSECYPEIITGMTIKPATTSSTLKIHHSMGKLKNPSINFNAITDTDTLVVNNSELPFVAIRRTNGLNRVDYSRLYETIDPNSYKKGDLITAVPVGKWTINRIYYDLYEKVFIQQYAPEVFDSSGAAMSALNDYVYPPPNDKMDYIVLCLLVLKQGCTNLNNESEAIFVKYIDRDVSTTEDDLIATDNVARQQVVILRNDFEEFKSKTNANITRIDNDIADIRTKVAKNASDIASLNTRLAETNSSLNSHIADKSNPHGVTKSQVGLGNVSNLSPSGIIDNQKDTTVLTKYVLKSDQIKNVSQLANDSNYVKSSDASIVNVKAASSVNWNSMANGEMTFVWG